MKTNAEYKARAKRLANAIAAVLNKRVTNAQALELVAKEENFPNWDALAGCAARTTVDVQEIDFQVTAYTRTETGKVGGFNRVTDDCCGRNDLRNAVQKALAAVEAGHSLTIKIAHDGTLAVIAPVHDEASHGFETHSFQISIVTRSRSVQFSRFGEAIEATTDNAGEVMSALITN